MNTLIIVESPTKASTLSRFLGQDYRIEATMGHIRDLPEKKLGITIERKGEAYTFLPQYQPIPDRKTRIRELKDVAQKSQKIILATDPDREGEAIAWHTASLLGSDELKAHPDSIGTKLKDNKDNKVNIDKTNNRFERIVFHEITKSAIEHALQHPRSIDMHLVDAQQARRILDRLVGYKLSPLLWNKLGKRWLSAGRVQSVAVRLIVDREREIEAFHPEEYWLIDVGLAKKSKENFLARFTHLNGKSFQMHNQSDANGVIDLLKHSMYSIESVEKKEARRYPASPFTTSTLQQGAANRFGWSAKRTMRAAQSLYEQGYITYHRTDSTNVSIEAISSVRAFISTVFPDALPLEARVYKTKSKVAQEAHEAIRPTHPGRVAPSDLKKIDGKYPGLENLPETVGRDGELLYSLIWKRFVACQMKEAIFDHTNAVVKAIREDESALLKASGEVMLFAGWTILYEKSQNEQDNNNEEEQEDKKILPPLTTGENLNFEKVTPQQKFTEPPARFTEATLIKILEEKGIGRPSTYAPIISTIQDRKYVEKQEKKFHPTDLGKTVVDFLVANFPDIFDIGFTSEMEEDLDNIANGEKEWNQVIGHFYSPFSEKLETVFKVAPRVKVDLGTTDEKCPECSNPLVVRLSKFGKFLACSTFPECKYTKNIVEKAGIPCPKCGGDIIVKKTRRGKQFYGCSNYPTCTFAAWKKEDIK